MRAYFDVDDINAAAVRVKELGGEAQEPHPAGHGVGRSLYGSPGQ